ncbi:MAG TPA: hypothetical protein VNR64_15870 [Vicinamibacterales bacterium]|nr:hypothetical protein [Vicinamibacterales bacterium]
MKKYGVGVVRERLAEALDYADRGVPVIIERRGVRYWLSVERPKKASVKTRKPYLEIVDPAIERGEWTWEWSPGELELGPRRRAK